MLETSPREGIVVDDVYFKQIFPSYIAGEKL